MKTCGCCKQSKPPEQFNKDSRAKDGLLWECRDCRAKRVSSRQSHLWKTSPEFRAKQRVHKARWDKANRVKRAAGMQRWKKNNPQKVLAHNMVAMAIGAGRIDRKPCEVCGNPRSEAHHDDYFKPLEVKWLCKKHHIDLHLRRARK